MNNSVWRCANEENILKAKKNLKNKTKENCDNDVLKKNN